VPFAISFRLITLDSSGSRSVRTPDSSPHMTEKPDLSRPVLTYLGLSRPKSLFCLCAVPSVASVPFCERIRASFSRNSRILSLRLCPKSPSLILAETDKFTYSIIHQPTTCLKFFPSFHLPAMSSPFPPLPPVEKFAPLLFIHGSKTVYNRFRTSAETVRK